MPRAVIPPRFDAPRQMQRLAQQQRQLAGYIGDVETLATGVEGGVEAINSTIDTLNATIVTVNDAIADLDARLTVLE